jgi:hypothetical protein
VQFAAVIEDQDIIEAVAPRGGRVRAKQQLDAITAHLFTERLAQRRGLAGQHMPGGFDEGDLAAQAARAVGLELSPRRPGMEHFADLGAAGDELGGIAIAAGPRTRDCRSARRRYARCLEARSARTQPARDLLEVAEALRERGVALRFVDRTHRHWDRCRQDALCRSGAVAQFERDVLRERTAAGMKAAKKRGTHLPHSRSHTPGYGSPDPQGSTRSRTPPPCPPLTVLPPIRWPRSPSSALTLAPPPKLAARRRDRNGSRGGFGPSRSTIMTISSLKPAALETPPVSSPPRLPGIYHDSRCRDRKCFPARRRTRYSASSRHVRP